MLSQDLLEVTVAPCRFVFTKARNISFLTQFDKDEMASDNRSSLLQRRDEMLLLSEHCFNSALGIEDGEPWLHHYILGKITEKLNKPPSVYLEHYQKVGSPSFNSCGRHVYLFII